MNAAPATEEEMRTCDAPKFDDSEQLRTYIDDLASREHDYGTSVYAMSLAATAAFNFIARKLGVTGFQAGCADMDILRRTRHIDGPFMVVEIGNALYPQYDLPGRVAEAIGESKDWLRDQARKKLEGDTEFTHPDVIAHWRKLAEAA